MEKWETIKEHSKYMVSNLGKVYNTKTKKMLKGCNNGKYIYVELDKKREYVHRLVARAFIPNPNNLPFINHKDGNPLNNNVKNLEWCTPKENVQHAVRTGLIKSGKDSPCYGRKPKEEQIAKMRLAAQKNKYLKAKKINQYDLKGNYIRTWLSINDAIKEYKNNSIEFCCAGKRKSAAGYQWKFYNGNIENINEIPRNIAQTQVDQYDLDGNFIKTWDKINDIRDYYGAKSPNIIVCCQNPNRTCKGFKWKYHDETQTQSYRKVEHRKENV